MKGRISGRVFSIFLILQFIYFSFPVRPEYALADTAEPSSQEVLDYHESGKNAPAVAVGENAGIRETEYYLPPSVDPEAHSFAQFAQESPLSPAAESARDPEIFQVQVPQRDESAGSGAEDFEWVSDSVKDDTGPLGAASEDSSNQVLIDDPLPAPEDQPAEQVEDPGTGEIPNDPYWSAGTDMYWVRNVRANEAWDYATGEGITVAVLDTGVDINHVELRDRIWVNQAEKNGKAGVDDDGNGYIDDINGWDFTSNTGDILDHHGHGTHVSGIVGAEENNGEGIAGIAPDVTIMPVQVLNDYGSGSFAGILNGIRYAADMGAQVINMSLGGIISAGSYLIEQLRSAVQYAVGKGTIVVAAAGNSNTDLSSFYPAAIPEVITVAALTSSNTRAYFSNYGNGLDVSAPGYGVLSLRAAGTTLGTPKAGTTLYTYASGTSMASPVVAGVVALMKSQDPDATLEDIHRRLRFSSADIGASGFDRYYGYGLVNALAAVSTDWYESGAVKTRWFSENDSGSVSREDYGEAGNVTARYQRNGEIISYFASGNELSHAYPDGHAVYRMDENFYGDRTGRISIEVRADGSYTAIEEYWADTDVAKVKAQYDSEGNLLGRTLYSQDALTNESRTYFDDGRVQSLTRTAFRAGGVLKEKEITTYGADGSVAGYQEITYHAGGQAAVSDAYRYEGGARTEWTHETWDASGKAETYWVGRYAAGGRLAEKDEIVFSGGLRTGRTDAFYDETGAVTEQFGYFYEYWDGSAFLHRESWQDLAGRPAGQILYDEAGRLVRSEAYDVTGQKTSRTTQEWDAGGWLERKTVETFAQGILASKRTETYGGKDVLARLEEAVCDAAGSIRSITSFEYQAGQVPSLWTREEFDADGKRLVLDSKNYDAQGNLRILGQTRWTYENGAKTGETYEETEGTKFYRVVKTFYANGQIQWEERKRSDGSTVSLHEYLAYDENGLETNYWNAVYESYWPSGQAKRVVRRNRNYQAVLTQNYEEGGRLASEIEYTYHANGAQKSTLSKSYTDGVLRTVSETESNEQGAGIWSRNRAFDAEGRMTASTVAKYAGGRVIEKIDERFGSGGERTFYEHMTYSYYADTGRIEASRYFDSLGRPTQEFLYSAAGTSYRVNYYTYDSAAGFLLSKTEYLYESYKLRQYMIIRYDARGGTVSVSRTVYTYVEGTSQVSETNTFDETDRLTNKALYDSAGKLAQYLTMQYHADGALKSKGMNSYTSAGTQSRYEGWTYDPNGILRGETLYTYYAGNKLEQTVVTYYDEQGLLSAKFTGKYDETGSKVFEGRIYYYSNGGLKEESETRFQNGKTSDSVLGRYDAEGRQTFSAHSGYDANGSLKNYEERTSQNGKETRLLKREYGTDGKVLNTEVFDYFWFAGGALQKEMRTFNGKVTDYKIYYISGQVSEVLAAEPDAAGIVKTAYFENGRTKGQFRADGSGEERLDEEWQGGPGRVSKVVYTGGAYTTTDEFWSGTDSPKLKSDYNWYGGLVRTYAVAETFPPSGSVAINNGKEYSASAGVTLSLGAEDVHSGIGGMRFSFDGGATWTDWESYSEEKAVDVTTVATASESFDGVPPGWNLPAGRSTVSGGALTLTGSGSGWQGTLSESAFVSTADLPSYKVEFNSATLNSKLGIYLDGNTASSQYRGIGIKQENGVFYALKHTGAGWTRMGTLGFAAGTDYVAEFEYTASAVKLYVYRKGENKPAAADFEIASPDWAKVRMHAEIYTGSVRFDSVTRQTHNAADGSKTVLYEIKDKSGNTARFSDSIVLDRTVPAGTVRIHDGQSVTNSSEVLLDLDVSDSLSGASQMRFSSDGGSTWTGWQGYGAGASVDISNGAYTNFTFDSVPAGWNLPAGRSTVSGGALTLTGSGSGWQGTLSESAFVSAADLPSYKVEFNSATLNSKLGIYLDGNTASSQYRGIGIKQENGVFYALKYTGSGWVRMGTLGFEAGADYVAEFEYTASAVKMYVYRKGEVKPAAANFEIASPDWAKARMHAEIYAGSVRFEQISYRTQGGADGMRTVLCQVKDAAGNVGQFTNSVLLDRSLPSGSVRLAAQGAAVSEAALNLNLTASDEGSAVSGMRFSVDDGSTWTDWEQFSSSKTLELEAAHSSVIEEFDSAPAGWTLPDASRCALSDGAVSIRGTGTSWSDMVETSFTSASALPSFVMNFKVSEADARAEFILGGQNASNQYRGMAVRLEGGIFKIMKHNGVSWQVIGTQAYVPGTAYTLEYEYTPEAVKMYLYAQGAKPAQAGFRVDNPGWARVRLHQSVYRGTVSLERIQKSLSAIVRPQSVLYQLRDAIGNTNTYRMGPGL